MRTKRDAEELIDKVWDEFKMDDNTGTDKVRDALVRLLVGAYEAGQIDANVKAAEASRK